MNDLVIKELNVIEEMESAYPLISVMYGQMEFVEYKARLQEMIAANDYKMVAIYLDGKMIAVAGYWIFMMLYCGRYLQVSNLIVDEKFRSQGIGSKILHYLENKAKDHGCEKIVLDSYIENKRSHPLYFRENFYIRGFHFMKDL